MDAIRLAPYRQGVAGRRVRPVLLLSLMVYSIGMGVGIAVLPPTMLFLFALPILIGFAATLWMLPDSTHSIPVGKIATLLAAYILVNCLWPSYIALNLPGAPWINPQRIVMLLLVTISLYYLATSKTLRHEVAESLRALPYVKIALFIFWITTVYTIFLSREPFVSANKWLNNQIFWTFLFGVAAWVSTKPGVIDRVCRILVWTAIIVSLEGIYEAHIQRVPWAEYIPQWMIGDPELVANILATHARAGTDVYRATGTFSVSLTFAEYLAMVYPFVIHATFKAKAAWQKAALVAGLVALVSAMWLTNARSGMIGFFMSIFLYGFFASLRLWKQRKDSLMGVTVLAMLPVAGVLFLALMLTWPRLHNMTIGGGQHEASTDARDAQWAMGVPKVLHNPIGNGAARSGLVLGYANPSGKLTIDTYYLTVLLEYGVLGFISFMVIFIGQSFAGLRIFLFSDTDSDLWAGPISIALLNFVVIKSVLSMEANVPVAYIMLGMLFAIIRMRQLRHAPAFGAPAREPQFRALATA